MSAEECVKCSDGLPAGGMCTKCVGELAREWGRQMVEACAEACEAERDRHELPGGLNDELRFLRVAVRSALESCVIRIRSLSPVVALAKSVEKPLGARECKGCGGQHGCTACMASGPLEGYWHPECLRKERARLNDSASRAPAVMAAAYLDLFGHGTKRSREEAHIALTNLLAVKQVEKQ